MSGKVWDYGGIYALGAYKCCDLLYSVRAVSVAADGSYNTDGQAVINVRYGMRS